MKAKTSVKLIVLSALLCLLPAFGRSKKKTFAERVVREVQARLVTAPEDQETCFSPDENCDLKLIKAIQGTTKSLDIAIFDLTHVQIAHEILMASARIPVRVLVDRRQSHQKHSLVSLLLKGKVNVRYGYQRGIMHNKFSILDGKMIETGSFNYTHAATQKNNENQIYLTSPKVVARYQERFNQIWAEGVVVEPEAVSRANR